MWIDAFRTSILTVCTWSSWTEPSCDKSLICNCTFHWQPALWQTVFLWHDFSFCQLCSIENYKTPKHMYAKFGSVLTDAFQLMSICNYVVFISLARMALSPDGLYCHSLISLNSNDALLAFNWWYEIEVNKSEYWYYNFLSWKIVKYLYQNI